MAHWEQLLFPLWPTLQHLSLLWILHSELPLFLPTSLPSYRILCQILIPSHSDFSSKSNLVISSEKYTLVILVPWPLLHWCPQLALNLFCTYLHVTLLQMLIYIHLRCSAFPQKLQTHSNNLAPHTLLPLPNQMSLIWAPWEGDCTGRCWLKEWAQSVTEAPAANQLCAGTANQDCHIPRIKIPPKKINISSMYIVSSSCADFPRS